MLYLLGFGFADCVGVFIVVFRFRFDLSVLLYCMDGWLVDLLQFWGLLLVCSWCVSCCGYVDLMPVVWF